MKRPKRDILKTAGVMLGAFLSAYLVMVWSQWDYIAAGFVTMDDTGIVLRHLAGGPALNVPDHGYALHRQVYTILAYFESLQVLQLGSLAFIALAGAMIAGVLFAISGHGVLSVAGALALASYPVAVDQGVMYITAMHATFGAMWAVGFVGLLWLAWTAPGGRFYLGVLLACAMAYLALRGSGTARLIAFAPVLSVLVLSIHRWPGWRRAGLAAGLAAAVPLVFELRHGLFFHHYRQDIPGRTTVAADNVLSNVKESIEAVLHPIVAAPWAVLALYVVGLATLGAALAMAARGARRHWAAQAAPGLAFADVLVLLVLCVIAAALYFGPAAAVTLFRPRYITGSFLLAGLGLAAMVVWLLARHGRMASWIGVAGTVALVVANLVRGDDLRAEEFGSRFETHKQVKALVQAERDRWPPDAQIVVLTAGRSPSEGTHHWSWSGWYVRALSGRHDVNALVGDVERAGEGIERDRPLYVYEYNEEADAFGEAEAAMLLDDVFALVPFGSAPAEGVASDIQDLSCELLEGSVLVGAITPDENSDAGAGAPGRAASGKRFVFDGSGDRAEELSVAPGEIVRLSFRLQSHGEPGPWRFSDTQPQMPMLSEALQVLRTRDGFWFRERKPLSDGANHVRVPEPENGTSVDIMGVEDCAMFLMADGRLMGQMIPPTVNGPWTLGGGHAERYWSGEILDWRLTTYTNSESR